MNDQQEREALPPLPEPVASQQLRRHNISGHERWFGFDAINPPHDKAHYAMAAARPRDLFTADQMHAYARAALAANVPAGWKLVPVEPTPEMLAARPPSKMAGSRRAVWDAMLAATPPAPAPEATPAAGPSGSFMTREQAIEFCRNRRPGIEPTEQHIAATIDAYAALFGDLVPAPEATPAPAEPYAHIVELPSEYSGLTKFFTAPSDPRGFPVYRRPPVAATPAQEQQADWLALFQPACRYISDVLASDAPPSEKHIARTIMHLLPLTAATPAPAPLTNAQFERLYNNLPPSIQQDARSRLAFIRIGRAVEAAHGIGKEASK